MLAPYFSINRVQVYLSAFALFSYCNLVLCRQKLHRFNAAVDGLFVGRGDNVCLGLCKCAAAMLSKAFGHVQKKNNRYLLLIHVTVKQFIGEVK